MDAKQFHGGWLQRVPRNCLGRPYTQINTVLDAAANYVDNTVQSGRTYYYVATAVSTAGVESAYSNEVTAVVPSP